MCCNKPVSFLHHVSRKVLAWHSLSRWPWERLLAADSPTMNEYITHQVNGYLFDPTIQSQLT